jgi:hypothetical protein
MNAIWQRPAFAGQAGPLLLHDRAPRRAGLGGVAAGLSRVWQWLDGDQRRRRQRPPGNGGSQPPEDHPRETSIWDDPNLWMLMIH